MLRHVGRVNRIHRSGGKRKAAADVQPDVDFMKRISVNVHETRQVSFAAPKVQIARFSFQ